MCCSGGANNSLGVAPRLIWIGCSILPLVFVGPASNGCCWTPRAPSPWSNPLRCSQGQIHQQFRFLTGNQGGRRRLKQHIPPGTEPHQVLEGNIPVKVTLPQPRKHLKGLLQVDGARGVQ